MQLNNVHFLTWLLILCKHVLSITSVSMSRSFYNLIGIYWCGVMISGALFFLLCSGSVKWSWWFYETASYWRLASINIQWKGTRSFHAFDICLVMNCRAGGQKRCLIPRAVIDNWETRNHWLATLILEVLSGSWRWVSTKSERISDFATSTNIGLFLCTYSLGL